MATYHSSFWVARIDVSLRVRVTSESGYSLPGADLLWSANHVRKPAAAGGGKNYSDAVAPSTPPRGAEAAFATSGSPHPVPATYAE
jgi:hypothetical protein